MAGFFFGRIIQLCMFRSCSNIAGNSASIDLAAGRGRASGRPVSAYIASRSIERLEAMTDHLTPLASGGLKRRALLRGGFLIGGLAAAGLATPVLTGVARATGTGFQGNWTWCKNCQLLYFGPKQSNSHCPAGGNHYGYKEGSDNYELIYDLTATAYEQPNWSWCGKCQGLFYYPNVGKSYCPDGGNHAVGAGSYNYSVAYSYQATSGGYQLGWNWCNKCQGLFFTESTVGENICPKDHLNHDGTGSFAYGVAEPY